MVYIVKIKPKRNFRNEQIGKIFKKGKTETLNLSRRQINELGLLHSQKGYDIKQPYEIISMTKR